MVVVIRNIEVAERVGSQPLGIVQRGGCRGAAVTGIHGVTIAGHGVKVGGGVQHFDETVGVRAVNIARRVESQAGEIIAAAAEAGGHHRDVVRGVHRHDVVLIGVSKIDQTVGAHGNTGRGTVAVAQEPGNDAVGSNHPNIAVPGDVDVTGDIGRNLGEATIGHVGIGGLQADGWRVGAAAGHGGDNAVGVHTAHGVESSVHDVKIVGGVEGHADRLI